MSQENVEIVKNAFVAFQEGVERGDFGGVFDSALMAEDAVWYPVPELADAEPARGAEEFRRFMDLWTEDFADWSYEAERFVDAGDRGVVLIGRQTARGKSSGVPIDMVFGGLYEIENGKVVTIRNFLGPDAALEAAGLDPARVEPA